MKEALHPPICIFDGTKLLTLNELMQSHPWFVPTAEKIAETDIDPSDLETFKANITEFKLNNSE